MAGFAIASLDPKHPLMNKGDWEFDFEIENADPLTGVVSGFASIEGIDRSGDMIIMEAFEKALTRLKDDDVQLPLALGHEFGINCGKITQAVFLKDSVPRKFFIEARLNKSKAGKIALDGIVKGMDPEYKGEDALRAFSIGGSALSKVRYCEQSGMCFNKIDDIELYHIALCGSPKNAGSLITMIKSALPVLRKIDYPAKDNTASEGSNIPVENLAKGEGEDVENEDDEDEKLAESLRTKGYYVISPPDLMKVMGEYSDFEDCVAKNQDKENPEAYCGAIKNQIEGKGELKMPDGLEEVKKSEPVAQPPAAAASTAPPAPAASTTPPAQEPAPAPAPAAAPVPTIDYKAEVEKRDATIAELNAKVSALEAEKKLNAKAAEPAAQAPAPAIAQPPPEQPDRKGVVQGPGNPGAGVSVMDMARRMNESGAPLAPTD